MRKSTNNSIIPKYPALFTVDGQNFEQYNFRMADILKLKITNVQM